MSRKKNPYRLPKNVIPERYFVRLEPNLNAGTFSGLEMIDVEVIDATAEIVLNAKDLEIEKASVFHMATRKFFTSESGLRISFDKKRDQLRLSLSEVIPHGSAIVRFAFSGVLNDKMRGFYRSTYKLPDSTERIMATTQFEPVDARRCFPCWDEPELKAVFDVELVVPNDRIALSNTRVVGEQRLPDDYKLVRFATTPRMSTYLLAFVVGDLEYVEGKTRDGVDVRVYTIPGKAEQGRFALDIGIKSLEYYTDYFGIPYPLPKLDMVAVPDFEAGAMENWGLVIYRENALLFAQGRSSQSTKQWVAEVVAHELAHQWFGNLVTMRWWDDLWLNESFATFMANKAVDTFFPQWDMWTQFLASETSYAMSLDALKTSHPIEVSVKNPYEIDQIFDAISYNKGGSILRMIEDFVGEESFRRGVSHYLREHEYDNATTEDLWRALAEDSGESVAEIMNTWTKQMGYPVLHVLRRTSGENRFVDVRQDRFLLDRDPDQPQKDRRLWQVPLRIIGENATDVSWLFSKRARVFPSPESGWIKLNPQHFGFYRTNYPPSDWAVFKDIIAEKKLVVADRLGLENDLYALTRAYYVPTDTFLEFLEAYKDEQEYSVWAELSGNIGAFTGLYVSEAFYPKLEAWGREMFHAIAERMRWRAKPQESELDAMLRGLALGAMVRYRDSATVAVAQERFEIMCKDIDAIDPNLRSVVLSAAALSDADNTFEKLCALEQCVKSQEEKALVLTSLGGFRDPRLLTKALDYALSPNVRSSDVLYVFRGTAHPFARDVVWNFIRDRWDELYQRFGETRYIGYLIASAVTPFASEEKAEEIEEFFKEHPAPTATMVIAQRIEGIRARAKFLERTRDNLAAWLANR